MGNEDSVGPDGRSTGTPPRKKTSHVLGSIVALLLLAALGGVSWWLTHGGKPVVAGGFGGGPGGPGGPGGASAAGPAASGGFRTSRIAAGSDAGGSAASGSNGTNLVAGGPAETAAPAGVGGAGGRAAGSGPSGANVGDASAAPGHAGGPGAAGSGASGGGAGGAGAPAGRRGAPATTVGVATASHADLPVVLEALGTVTPVANVTVRPQVSGIVTQVLFKEGQMVKKGDLLATIDPQQYQMALSQAQGATVRDQASL
ncbi:MAG: secretion protein HlyD, partial [Rhizobacter sp.]|nr:secretion protein HlyD [Rhizobacter sp.]